MTTFFDAEVIGFPASNKKKLKNTVNSNSNEEETDLMIDKTREETQEPKVRKLKIDLIIDLILNSLIV